jgi:hypothetical protein
VQVVVRQISGLGNQLFQYAAGRYYAKRYSARTKIAIPPAKQAMSHGSPRPFLLSHFSIAVPTETLSLPDRLILSEARALRVASFPLKRALRIQVFTEQFARRYSFLPDLPLQPGIRTLYLVGYWQNYLLVEKIADELRTELRFREPATGKNQQVLEQIRQTRNPVSLHVRRGDYAVAFEGDVALPFTYYFNAISIFKQRLNDPTFFVFSDDIPFARNNLPRDIKTVFVEHNDGFTAHEDLRLMSSCRHHIIANSTFSWWGAWLNSSDGKIVIAPKQWLLTADSEYFELLPPDWTLADITNTTITT